MTLEAISKMQTPFKDKPATITAGKARTDPPSFEKLWRDRRKSQCLVPKMNLIRQSTVADKVGSV
jgi:hypothetical protein